MILLLNGAFGIGKSTVARALAMRLPDSVLFDPEPIGVLLQRGARLGGAQVDDFQDLRAWRWLTTVGIRLAKRRSANVIVPMAFSNLQYLDSIRRAVARFESHVVHVCLIAPVAVVHGRLERRGAKPTTHAWEYRRAAECCAAHADPAFATHMDAADRTPDDLAEQLLTYLSSS